MSMVKLRDLQNRISRLQQQDQPIEFEGFLKILGGEEFNSSLYSFSVSSRNKIDIVKADSFRTEKGLWIPRYLVSAGETAIYVPYHQNKDWQITLDSPSGQLPALWLPIRGTNSKIYLTPDFHER